MSLMISLPSDLEAALKREADRAGVDTSQFAVNEIAKQVALRQVSRSSSPEETALIAQIYTAALPPKALRRLRYLAVRRQAEKISSNELEELKSLSEESERLNVIRLEHLIALASIRGVSLPHVMEQLSLGQPGII